jgi:hypothetical protein
MEDLYMSLKGLCVDLCAACFTADTSMGNFSYVHSFENLLSQVS